MFIILKMKICILKKEIGFECEKMVKLDLKYGLSFCTFMLSYEGKCMQIDNVLLDTGSGDAVFK